MLTYVDLGLPVVPLCPPGEAEHARMSAGHKRTCRCRGKVPVIAGWVNKKETTAQEAKDWLAEFPDMNIGLSLGSAAGYVGIDVDGVEGEDLLQEMSGGDLPTTWEFNTGEGRRLIYNIPIGLPTKKFVQTGEEVHQECAILCTGQLTVIPPSVHHTGVVYTWHNINNPQYLDCCMAPDWLITLIRQDIPEKSNSQVMQEKLYTERIISIADEFNATPFVSFIPDSLLTMESTEVKKQKSSKAAKSEPGIDSYLYQIINEGARDNNMTKIIGHFLSKQEYRSMPKNFFTQFIYNYNDLYCVPPLDKDALDVKITYLWEAEQQKSAGYKKAQSEREFISVEVAQMVRNKLEEDDLLIKFDKATDSFYFCHRNIGPWVDDENGLIESKVWSYITDERLGEASWGTQHRLHEVLEALELDLRAKGRSRKRLFDMNVHKDILSQYIVVDGKLLNWRDGELLDWNPEYNTTVNFNINFDPEATCPNWEEYMQEWLPDKTMRDILQEFMGSCLLPEPAPEEKFIILAGGGSNGKSMFLKGMQQIFKNYSISLTPQKLAERFGPSSLYGKLVNICSEIEGDGGYLKNTAQLKSIVSGEPLTAEYKGLNAFQFEPVANLLFSCNTVPKTKDKTDGWYRRQLIIPFDQKFTANSVTSQKMITNMTAEMPGIFNWLISGLRRVKARGYFIVSTDLKAVQHVYKASNDPMEGFLTDCIKKVSVDHMYSKTQSRRADQGISTAIVMQLYECWCKYSYGDNSNYQKSPRNFNQELLTKQYTKGRGLCILTKKVTSLIYGIDVVINNPELYDVIENMCCGCSVSEPGYYLAEIVREQRKEENAKDSLEASATA